VPALEACWRCQIGSIATCATCGRRHFPSDGGRLPWRCAICRKVKQGTVDRERIALRESICPCCGLVLPAEGEGKV